MHEAGERGNTVKIDLAKRIDLIIRQKGIDNSGNSEAVALEGRKRCIGLNNRLKRKH